MSQAEAIEREPLLLGRALADGVRLWTLNRPEARNALSTELMSELEAAIAAAADDPAVRVIILAAAGPAFCSGHDLRELRAHPEQAFQERVFEQCARLMLALLRLGKPVVARVQGTATAAGCQLVATCDLAVASTEARFATPGVNIGLFCSTPMVALSRAVGRKAALEMLLTGETIDAETARRIGLVNRVVSPDRLEAEALRLAGTIAEKPAAVVALGKEAFYRQVEMEVESAYAYTARVMAENMMAREAAEGIDAFLDKRAPRWGSDGASEAG